MLITLAGKIARCAGLVLFTVGASPNAAAQTRLDRAAQIVAYETEIQHLAADLEVPGYAYAIVEDGAIIAKRGFGAAQGDPDTAFTTASTLRIASVTKALTATLAMQLVEEGKLDLSAPAKHYANDLPLPDTVQVQHLLTHSSEGVPGEEYVYGTVRYSMLAQVLSAAGGKAFHEALRTRIIDRAGMRWHDSEQLGAHGGLVSSVDDMARYIVALDRGTLLTAQSLGRLTRRSQLNPGRILPLSLGWFVQDIQGEPVMWSYGQDDPEHSGVLMLRLPERKLTLFLLANSNAVSDAFRLLMGDARKSPFAMSFLRLFAFSKPGLPLPALPVDGLETWLDEQERKDKYRYRDELVGLALIDAWRQRRDAARAKTALALRRYDQTPDPVLHFAIMQSGPGPDDQMAIQWGRRLLAEHPNNRWILLAQGYLLLRTGDKAGASRCFEAIVALPNQQQDFLHLLFKSWAWLALAEMTRETDPLRARSYLRNVIDSGVKGPTLDSAEKALKELGS